MKLVVSPEALAAMGSPNQVPLGLKRRGFSIFLMA
jgi:hypothetical protein